MSDHCWKMSDGQPIPIVQAVEIALPWSIKNGESRWDNERGERGNRSASRLGKSGIHFPHFSQCPSPLWLPRTIWYPLRINPSLPLIALFNLIGLRKLFLFSFSIIEATTKNKLAKLNEKLDTLERRLELLEVQVGTATANPAMFTTWLDRNS